MPEKPRPKLEVGSPAWEGECRFRIRRLLAAIYIEKGITIARAQEIIGDFADADSLLESMLESKQVMRSRAGTGSGYEFTHDGLVDWFGTLLDDARVHYAHEPDEVELYGFVLRESKRLVATPNDNVSGDA